MNSWPTISFSGRTPLDEVS